MLFKVCPECGATLDPDERCDCYQAREERRKLEREMISVPVEKNGQLELKLSLNEGGDL